ADGSAGYYEWYTDGTPGLYTMSYSHPSGYPLSVKCVAQPGAIDPTGLGDPVNLGSDTLGMYLADTSCGSNPYYLAFMLEPGDPYIHRNNLAVQCVLIGSVACADLNGNHVSDIGEPGLDGVLVELYDCLDSLTVLDSVRTVMGGQYRFDG